MEKQFFEFIYNRHTIWYKKTVMGGSGPWSDDDILNKMKFCNVYRFLDKGTKYIYTKLEGKSNYEVLLNVLYARFFNQLNIFENSLDGLLFSDVVDRYTIDEVYSIIKSSDTKMFNDAYIITQMPFNSDKWKGDKIGQVLQCLYWVRQNSDSILDKINKSVSADSIYHVLTSVKMIGHFLAGQIMVDLSYFNMLGSRGWTNNDFLVVGPGAAAGIELMCGPGISDNDQRLYVVNLRDIQVKMFEVIKDEYGKDFFKIAVHRPPLAGIELDGKLGMLSLMDIQHSLCEFRKYLNWSGDKRCKKRYYK